MHVPMLFHEIAVLAKFTPVFMGLADLAYFLKEENNFLCTRAWGILFFVSLSRATLSHVGDMVIPCLRQCSETEYTKWVKKLVYQGLRSVLHQQTVPLENETSFAKQSKI